MANYLIAYGGTGQHAALAYARLCFLCKDIIDALDSPGTGRLPFFYVFDKDVGAGDGDSKTAGTLLFDYAKRLSNNTDINAVDPIPKVEANENIQTLSDLLKHSSEIAKVLFTNYQLNVKVVHGNFGQPAVGALGLYIKLFDTLKRDNREVNKDTAFANLCAGIQNAGGQKIAHVGSAIGGTGSGVMPASVSLFAGLHAENSHFSLSVLEWFKLVGAGKSDHEAANRNSLIRQNRSSGLHFYLQNLQKTSSVLPLGYSRERLENSDCQRPWQGDYNQAAKESAIHLAAALAIWEFYFRKTALSNGMYSYVPDDNDCISDVSKLAEYTLGSVLAANLRLIEEVGQICHFLKNPPSADYILFPYLKEKVTFQILKGIQRTEWAKIADALQALISTKREATEWLQGLDFVNQTIKTAKETVSFKGLAGFSKLFPKEAGSGRIVDSIYTYLVDRAKLRLQPFKSNAEDKTLTSGKRLLPGYAKKGVNPSPALKGTLAPISDPNHIKRLYMSGEIAPESIPSPLGAIHSINLEIDERLVKIDNPAMDNDTIQEEQDELIQANAQRRKLLFDRYLLLFKGLIAGKVVPKKQLLWEERENRSDKKGIGWVLGHLRSGEDQRYAELPEPYIYYLTFTTDKNKDKNKEVIMGATTPTIFLFPSMSAEEDIWDALDRSVKFIGNDVLIALAQWCEHIKQRDGLNDHERPRWFRILWREFTNYSGMQRSREIEAPEDTFPVFWVEKFINIPMLRLKEEV